MRFLHSPATKRRFVGQLKFIQARPSLNNDQPIHPGTRSFVYADDLAVATQSTDFAPIEETLTSALEGLTEYYTTNQLRANPMKTQVSLFHLRNRDCGKQLNISWNGVNLKAATGRPCVLASAHSGTVPAITCDCSPVAESLMRRRYFDLCVTASSRTMLTFENNVSCSSRD